MKTIELIILTGNVYEKNVEGLGSWGGTCRCPDGLEYEVADKDACNGLQCENGVKVSCNKYDNNAWKKNKVTCSTMQGKI